MWMTRDASAPDIRAASETGGTSWGYERRGEFSEGARSIEVHAGAYCAALILPLYTRARKGQNFDAQTQFGQCALNAVRVQGTLAAAVAPRTLTR